MKVRKMDADGDMTFGHGIRDFYVNQPEAVAQCALTRLRLWQGQWFYDLSEGTPYQTRVLGKYTGQTRDPAMRARVLGTPGVKSIVNYSSAFNPDSRQFSLSMTLNTIYGQATVSGVTA